MSSRKWSKERYLAWRREQYKRYPERYTPPIQKQPEPKKGVAETLASLEVTPLIQRPRIHPTPKKEPVKTRPFAGVAGVIAPTERLAYSAARLVGVETPRPPPTVVSMEHRKAVKYGPEYAAGTITGEILLGLGVGKGVEKAWKHAPKIVKAPVEKAAAKIGKAARPVTRRLEPVARRLQRLALWPHEKVAPGIVSIPTPERVSMKSLEAQLAAWQLAETPKTSAFLVSKVPSAPTAKAWVAERWIRRVTGGLSYALVKEELAEIPAKFDVPHVPKTVVAPKHVLPKIAGVGLTLTAKARQYEEPFEIQRLRLGLIERPTQREKTRQVVVPILTPLVSQKQKTMQMQIPSIPKYAPSVPTFKPPILPPYMPRAGGFDISRLRRGLFGKWFKREHRILGPRRMAKRFGLPMPKRRKRVVKRKTRRRKKKRKRRDLLGF